MKTTALICFLLIITNSKAATYFISTNFGDDSRSSEEAQNLVTPWKTINKLNSYYNLQPGDSVLFNRGETFFGTLLTNTSGRSENFITYGAYGEGPNPKITSLSVLESWTLYNGNIYYCSVDIATPNIVCLDGTIQPMGRYPRSGYLPYTSHTGNSSITGESVANLPFDAMGAEVVIRKIRQVTDRHIITFHSGNTLGLSSAGEYGTNYANNTSYTPNDGNGYFIQSSIHTLSQKGDWYYDNAAKRLYMYFGTEQPSDHTINVSTSPHKVQIFRKNYIVIRDIDFEGSNSSAVEMLDTDHIIFSNCNFYKNRDGIVSPYNSTSNLIIQNCKMEDQINNGVLIQGSVDHVIIDNCVFNNIGTIAGSGGSGDGMQLGIWIAGNNTSVSNCILTKIGYHGICLYGNNTLIEKNLINNYGLVKDDCGGIYEFQFSGIQHTNKIIRYNTILNGVGVGEGVPWYEVYGKAAGIYLDANVTNVQVYNNVIAHGNWSGIVLIDVGPNNYIERNVVYDFLQQLHLFESPGMLIRNNSILENHFVARTINQKTLYVQLYHDDDPSLFGVIDKNIYARPISDSETITLSKEYAGGGISILSLASWKTTYKQDYNSKTSYKTVEDTEMIRFEYNFSNVSKPIALHQEYIDLVGKNYNFFMTLPPFSSILLMSEQNNQLLPLQSINLKGKRTNNQINLLWKSEDLTNLERFDVEKSDDGVKYKKLTSFSSDSTSGTFTLTDTDVTAGNLFYRVKQIGNGKTHYSNIVRFDCSPRKIYVYPNPMQNYLDIQSYTTEKHDKISIIIRNVNGNVINNLPKIQSQSKITLNTSSLQKGTYILNIQINNCNTTKLVIKQ